MNLANQMLKRVRVLTEREISNSTDPKEGSTMFYIRSLVVALFVLAAVLAMPGFQALANHTADVGFRILKVRVLGDTDDWPAGCSDVYVKVKVISTTGQERNAQTGVAEEICPVQTIFQNVLLNLTPTGQSKIVSGPFKLTFRVMDEDDLSDDDEMNNKTVHNIPCNGKAKTINDLAHADQFADIKVRARCTPIAHTGNASELSDRSSLPSQFGVISQNEQIQALRVFNSAGQPVMEMAGAESTVEALAANAQGRLANGVYLYVATVNMNGQLQKKFGKLVVMKSGQIQAIQSTQPEASTELSLGNQLVPLKTTSGVCPFVNPTLVGTNNADNLFGTPGNDVIFGKAGDDFIDGRDGSDRICGGLGNDKIYDGPGRDYIYGEAGNDRIVLITGDGARDEVYAGSGNDYVELMPNSGPALVNCGSGVDTVRLNGNPVALVTLIGCENVLP